MRQGERDSTGGRAERAGHPGDAEVDELRSAEAVEQDEDLRRGTMGELPDMSLTAFKDRLEMTIANW